MNANPRKVTPDNPVVKLVLGTLDLVVVRGAKLRPVTRTEDDGGWLFERVDVQGMTVAYDDAALWVEQTVNGFRHHEGYFERVANDARVKAGVATFDDIPAHERPLLVWKFGWGCALRDLLVEKRVVAAARNGKRGSEADDPHADLLGVSLSDAGLARAIALIHKRRVSGDGLRKPVDGRGQRSGPDKRSEDELPRVKALRTWHKELRKGGWNPIVLRLDYRKCGGKSPKVADLCEELMAKHAAGYAHVDRPTQVHQHDLLLTEIAEINKGLPEADRIRPPCLDTFRDRIRAMDPFYVKCMRKGVEAGAHDSRIITQGAGATIPGERVEMDEWNIQLKVVLQRAGLWQTLSKKARKEIEKGRLWLCVAIDCATRVVLGASLSLGQSTDSVIACLRMIVSNKADYAAAVGARSPWTMAVRPRLIVTDAGSTFVNDRVREKLAGLRIDTAVAIAGQASMRGTIERFFSTVHTSLLSRLPGRTFENVVAKGDYPDHRVGLDVDDLVFVIFRWLHDEYPHRPHAGLGGETPANAWKRLTRLEGLRPLPGPDEKRAVFGVDLTRRGGPLGVRVFGLDYQSRPLQAHLRRRGPVDVKVRVDVEDLGHVSVFLADAWETVACVSDGFDGVSLRDWEAAARALRARFGREAALSRAVVQEALRDIRTRVTKLIEVIGLDADLPSARMIKRVEDGLDVGFRMPSREDGDGSRPDLLAHVRAATGGAPSRAGDGSEPDPRPGLGASTGTEPSEDGDGEDDAVARGDVAPGTADAGQPKPSAPEAGEGSHEPVARASKRRGFTVEE